MTLATSKVGQTADSFVPHPNLSDEINGNICRSEIEGGVWIDRLPRGTILEMETANRFYLLEYRGDGRVLIWGHPKFCPRPVVVDIHGSTWGRSMLKMRFIGRGMYLEFGHPTYGMVLTSPVVEIRELAPEHEAAQRLRAAGEEFPDTVTTSTRNGIRRPPLSTSVPWSSSPARCNPVKSVFRRA